MPVSNSRLSYSDCFALFERALEDPVGARYQVPGGELGRNRYFVMRMHQARGLDRQDNKLIYQPGEPLYGRSQYDVLVCQLKEDVEGGWWVYVSHTEIDQNEIESLSEVPIIEAEYSEVGVIEEAPKLALITDQSIRRRV